MANRDSTTTLPSEGATNNVSIRVIALAHATNQNEDVHLVLNLDTTVAQLKERLQENLSQRPRPETQRLIYQGRPLTDNDATLRQTLRLEPGNANALPAHVLHLVIRESPASAVLNTSRQQPTPVPTTAPNPPFNPQPGPQAGPLPHPQGIAFPQQNALAQAQAAQAMMQNHLNAFQQHMALQNQNAHQFLPPNGLPGHIANSLPNLNPFTGIPAPQPPYPGDNAQNETPVSNTTDPRPSSGAGPNNQPNMFQGSMTMRIHETIGPNGERIRRVVQSGPVMQGQETPVERSASAPGTAGRLAGTVPANRTNVIPSVPAPGMLGGQPPPLPFPFPQNRFPTHGTGVAGTPLAMQARNPVLWLVTSPTGPEALLFAPNHGLFSSQQATQVAPPLSQTQTNQTEISSQSQQTQTQTQTQTSPASAAPVHRRQENQRNAELGPVALRGQPRALREAQPQPQPARREGEDILTSILQRAWLFLRLYMFIFVLSEPGTWRRYILLTIASLIARRHFDNLIGPPQLPRPQREPREAGNRDDATPQLDGQAHRSPTPQQNQVRTGLPTPEEHARRLLREHEEQNPSFVRDTIYRLEQAVALFLASLIPGVGERHVRAREEARRLVQEEEERRRREAAEQAEQQSDATTDIKSTSAQAVDSSSPEVLDGSSSAIATGVDVTSSSDVTQAENEGVRLRSTDADS